MTILDLLEMIFEFDMSNAKLTRPIKSRLAFIAYPNVTCTPGVAARCAVCDIFTCLMGEVFSGDQHLLESF